MDNIFQNRLIFGKYKIIKKIGKGAFSSVFKAKQLINQKMVAMKVQKKINTYGNLEEEAYFLYELQNIGIPKFFSYGHYRNYNILVEELLGKTIDELFKENKKTQPNFIRLKDMILVGIQIIDRIKYIHSKDILHLDIKPTNILVGNPDNSLIYIIDFGFAKKYRSSRTGNHIKFSKSKYFNGNLLFSSLNTMRGVEPSRRDDLESIGYMLIYLYNQRLPWIHLKMKNEKELCKKVFEIKTLISIKMICENTPKEMIEFIKYVKLLKFDEKPNYNYLTHLLEIMLKKINRINDMNFSWINKLLIRNNSNVKSSYRKVSPFSKILNNLKIKKELKNNINIIKEETINNKKNKSFRNEETKLFNNKVFKYSNLCKNNSFENKTLNNMKFSNKMSLRKNFFRKIVLNHSNNNVKLNANKINYIDNKKIYISSNNLLKMNNNTNPKFKKK